MSARAFVFAALAAVAGAAVWAGVAILTKHEVGWVAWGIGALVGGAAAWAGARGSASGAICAALALVAIFGGKVFAMRHLVLKEVREKYLTRSMYEESVDDARDLAALASDDDHPAFMVQHRYTEASTADAVSARELVDFRNNTVPMLRRLHAEGWDYDRWVSEATADFDFVQAAKDELGPIDIVFALLGIATAFQLGARGTGTAPAAAPRAPRAPPPEDDGVRRW